MLILAFDTSGTSGSVAIVEGDRVLRESELDRDRRSAQTLAPAFHRLLSEAHVQPQDIRLIATTIGPGSFTGLRIGVTAAKTFAYAVGADVIGVSTLEALAAAAPSGVVATPREVQAVLDAQRGELFVGRFRIERPAAAGELPSVERLAADQVMNLEHWRGGLPAGSLVTGTGLRRVNGVPAGVEVVRENLWEPKAAVIGRLAWRYYELGRRDDLWKLAPVYLRPSYADEKAEKGISRGLPG